MSATRILIMHRAGVDGDGIRELGGEIKEAIHKKDEAKELKFFSGAADFRKFFDGSWEDWADSIPLRKKYGSRDKYYYDLLVLPIDDVQELTIGKATGDIIVSALKNRRPLRVFDRDKKQFHKLQQIQIEDELDYTRFWRVTLKQVTP